MGGILDQVGGYILGLIGAASLGGLLYLGYLSGNTSQTAALTLQLANDIKGLFGASTGSYSTLTNAAAESGGIMPSNWIKGAVGAGTDKNPWGGAVALTPYSGGSRFWIAQNGLPPRACVQLMQALAGGALQVSTNSNPWRTAPVDGATVASDCSSATNTVYAGFQ